MKNCGILIEIDGFLSATNVENFSKENVIGGISKLTKFKKANIVQLSTSMSGGIYALKKPVANNKVKLIIDLFGEYPLVFEVKYINNNLLKV